MKKNTIEMMHAYLNGQTVDVDALRADVAAEYEKVVGASRAKMDMYEAAKPVIFAAITGEALTVKAIYEKCAANLPEEMTASRIQYALLNYWSDEVVKSKEGKSAATYTLKW